MNIKITKNTGLSSHGKRKAGAAISRGWGRDLGSVDDFKKGWWVV